MEIATKIKKSVVDLTVIVLTLKKRRPLNRTVAEDELGEWLWLDGRCGLKARRSFLQLIWLLTTWVIWNERNHRIFQHKENSIDQLLDKVKYYSLWWLKAHKVVFTFGDHLWWSSPMSCLGIG
ncbi:hypothetical protein MTR_2g087750 [Medicago truncatula]|uniref:Uncharacterized protein n=1 Tax=Medicago truncatula TaxID=3880 RepID=G7IRH5_MEDTR|nr:hypothetical protein MTR_2g087750 [Medicago truncatula]